MQATHRLTALVFVLLLLCPALLFWILPDADFSETENRALQTLPSFTREGLFSGRYAARMDDYFTDQLPLRNALVFCKSDIELALGKGENDGILCGENGQLARCLFEMRRADGSTVSDSDRHDPSHIRASAEGINRLASALDIPFAAWITPRTLDVAASDFLYPKDLSDALHRDFWGSIGEGVNCPDLITRYRALHLAGEEVYYRTDHHWTTRGAYLAYRDLLLSWGMGEELLAESDFQKVTVPDFSGTFRSAGGMHRVAPDSLELWKASDDGDYIVTADGRVSEEGFYSTRFLSGADKYSVFLDGTHDVVTVTRKDARSRPRLLVVKDSFANAMVPFLARHFDLVILNLSSARTDYTHVSALAEEHAADRVLLVYTLGNVVATDRLVNLH